MHQHDIVGARGRKRLALRFFLVGQRLLLVHPIVDLALEGSTRAWRRGGSENRLAPPTSNSWPTRWDSYLPHKMETMKRLLIVGFGDIARRARGRLERRFEVARLSRTYGSDLDRPDSL